MNIGKWMSISKPELSLFCMCINGKEGRQTVKVSKEKYLSLDSYKILRVLSSQRLGR